MRKRQQDRYMPEQRQNTERCLQQQHPKKNQSAGATMSVIGTIASVERCQGKQQVGNHAMGKLHCEVIFEQVEPCRLKEQQVLAARNQCTVDRWPCVVDEACPEASD